MSGGYLSVPLNVLAGVGSTFRSAGNTTVAIRETSDPASALLQSVVAPAQQPK